MPSGCRESGWNRIDCCERGYIEPLLVATPLAGQGCGAGLQWSGANRAIGRQRGYRRAPIR